MPDSKKLSFSNPPILNIFGPNFQRLVLFYMKYIYAKGNVVQQIQLSNCPMFCQKWAKNAFLFSLFLILHLTAWRPYILW